MAIGLRRVFNDISLDAMKDVFPLNTSSNYNIKNKSTYYSKSVISVYNGTELLLHLPLNIWELVPNDIKAVV